MFGLLNMTQIGTHYAGTHTRRSKTQVQSADTRNTNHQDTSTSIPLENPHTTPHLRTVTQQPRVFSPNQTKPQAPNQERRTFVLRSQVAGLTAPLGRSKLLASPTSPNSPPKGGETRATGAAKVQAWGPVGADTHAGSWLRGSVGTGKHLRSTPLNSPHLFVLMVGWARSWGPLTGAQAEESGPGEGLAAKALIQWSDSWSLSAPLPSYPRSL